MASRPLVFRFYAVNFGHYQATYGAIGGVILLLLWFYVSGLSIVIGAEINAEIEQASPSGKAPGEKVPDQKKQIGAAVVFLFWRPLRRRRMHAWPSESSARHDRPTLADCPRRHGFCSSISERKGVAAMLYYALVFLVVGLIAGLLGATGVAGVATQIAWVLFLIGIVLLIIHLVTGTRRPTL